MHAGVKIPKFEQLHTGGEGTKLSLTGLGSGGQQIQTCRKAFINSIELLVQLASLQTAFLTLDVAIKTTNRRVNALDNVVRPKLENTISYIKVQTVSPLSSHQILPLHCWAHLTLQKDWQCLDWGNLSTYGCQTAVCCLCMQVVS